MFTGIIETTGKIESIRFEGSNAHLHVLSSISKDLKIDQSVSHNGVCLTVVELYPGGHIVTAVKETLNKTNTTDLQIGDLVNLERCTQLGHRLDGHLVQGHVDETTLCTDIEDLNGSWKCTFKVPKESAGLLIPQGSICVNGISLTIANLENDLFQVAIIPYTFEHTTFRDLKVNDVVNLEYDVIGKYVLRHMELRHSSK